jgi:chromosome partitioning protein
MATIIAVMNQKGGSAKTTTTLNLAGYIAQSGCKTLMVDADPQSSLSISVGEDIFKDKKRLSDVLIDDQDIRDIIFPFRDHLFVAPTDLHLAKVELSLLGELSREYRLKDALTKIRNEYDFIFIDCPPSLAMMTVNSLAAADCILIPSSCDYLSMWGVQILYTTILSIRKKINPGLKILGLVRTQFDGRTKHAKEIAAKTEELYRKHMRIFKTIIRTSTHFKDSLAAHKTIFEYSPTSQGAEDYSDLGHEFLETIDDDQ